MAQVAGVLLALCVPGTQDLPPSPCPSPRGTVPTWPAPPPCLSSCCLSSQDACHTPIKGHPESQGCPLASKDPSREALDAAPGHAVPGAGHTWAQDALARQPGRGGCRGSQAGASHADSSCLLTPPSTPLGLEPGGPSWPEHGGPYGKAAPEGQGIGLGGPPAAVLEGEIGACSLRDGSPAVMAQCPTTCTWKVGGKAQGGSAPRQAMSRSLR
jgi:hypothetical protein